MLKQNLQYKKTSRLTEQSKRHYPLYWPKNIQLLSLIFHSIHPWISAFSCFVLLGGKKKTSWEEESAGEKTCTQWFRGIVWTPAFSLWQPALIADPTRPHTPHFSWKEKLRHWYWSGMRSAVKDAAAAHSSQRCHLSFLPFQPRTCAETRTTRTSATFAETWKHNM